MTLGHLYLIKQNFRPSNSNIFETFRLPPTSSRSMMMTLIFGDQEMVKGGCNLASGVEFFISSDVREKISETPEDRTLGV